MTTPAPTTISVFSADDLESYLAQLGALMHACVHSGASIGYVLPYSTDDGAAFWRKNVLPGLRTGGLVLLVARRGECIVGSVQLDYDMPPNQPHRAEVRKLMVHPDCRRQGVAQALMARLEQLAVELGRSLLVLDTRTGDKAEPLYAALGYTTVGTIPGYCRDPFDGRLDSTTIMYKNV
ncbi:MAG TPA: GNAT family N-acetyltransferase [Telluria sp.]